MGDNSHANQYLIPTSSKMMECESQMKSTPFKTTTIYIRMELYPLFLLFQYTDQTTIISQSISHRICQQFWFIYIITWFTW